MSRIAIVQFPGSNCEAETARAVRDAGGAPEIVRFLISRGANLKAQNKRGQTPLAAAQASRRELGHLVEILKAAEAQ